MSLLTKLSSEVSEMKDSKTANEEQPLSFENSYPRTSSGSTEKNSQSLEDFFKEKLSEKNKKPEERKNHETHIDDIEERPREKLWKRYGDFRGEVFHFFVIERQFEHPFSNGSFTYGPLLNDRLFCSRTAPTFNQTKIAIQGRLIFGPSIFAKIS